MENQTNEAFSSSVKATNIELDRSSSKNSNSRTFHHKEEGRHGRVTVIKPNRFFLILISLTVIILLSAMDSTVISTALSGITKDFRSLDEVTWITTPYLLTSTALQPLYGRFSDRVGRKLAISFALILFMIGSAGCGLSEHFISLVVFRAVAGMGGGGLLLLSMIVLSDMVPLSSRSIYIGGFSALFALGSVLGPMFGGFITDYLGWRYIFYINLPLAGLALLIIILFLPPSTDTRNIRSRWKHMDFLGTLTLTLSILLFVLGLNWGGNDYDWSSLPVILSLISSGILAVLFIFVEAKQSTEPLIPYYVLTNNVISAISTAFLNGAVFYSLITYTTIYYQVALVESATSSGLELLPLLVGVTVFSIASGFIINQTGSYRSLSRVGSLVALVGILLMAGLLEIDLSKVLYILFMALVGVGIGCCLQTNIVSSQAAVAPAHVAVVTSLVNFAQSLGGIVGLTAVGAVYHNFVVSYLKFHLPSSPHSINSLIDSSDILKVNLDPFIKATLADAYVEAYRHVFLTCIPFALMAFISTLFLTHIPLTQTDYKENEIKVLPMVMH